MRNGNRRFWTISAIVTALGALACGGFPDDSEDSDVVVTPAPSPGPEAPAAGMLDSSFGDEGVVALPSLDGLALVTGVAVQADGKIVAVGYSTFLQVDVVVVRLLADGSIDSSFSNDGFVTVAGGVGALAATALAIQPDGKIVVVGTLPSVSGGVDMAIIRINGSGTLDSGFSGDGMLLVSVTGDSYAHAVAIQADGRIVVAGGTWPTGDFVVIRMSAAGVPDTTFGVGGVVVTPVLGGGGEARALALQADGKIVAAGTAAWGETCATARYTSAGVPDSTFGGTGIVITQVDLGSEEIRGIAIQPDGKIVAVGSCDNNHDVLVMRFMPNGSLDTAFEGEGGFIVDFEGADGATAVALQPDGKIVVVGNSAYFSQAFLMRLAPDGRFDASFGDDGAVFTEGAEAAAVAIQADGRIVVAGTYDMGLSYVPALLRFR